jgi:3-hydroxypropanoate dehydrogenase
MSKGVLPIWPDFSKSSIETQPRRQRTQEIKIMSTAIQHSALNQLFDGARTYNQWSDKPVNEKTIHELYDHLKWGPTSANCCPARFVWVRSAEGKAKLAALAMEPNRPKILAAPVTVIIAHDLAFPETLPKLFPERAKAMQQFFNQPGMAEVNAMRNGTLQGAYLIIGARALGLDCGPMSGFDNAGVDAAFFSDTTIKSNFICSIGYGVPGTPYPRNPRLTFEEACQFA